jgi:hypothetical protein
MTDARELQEFSQRLNADVRERASGLGDDGTPNFRENVFTELLCEYLSEIGVIEDATTAFCEIRSGRGVARVNGYSLADDSDRLDLIASVFLDSADAVSISKEDIQRAAARAERFLEGALTGLHAQMESASDAQAMAARIHEMRDDISSVRIFIITDGLSNTKVIDESNVRGVPVRFEIWDIERLFRGMQAGLPRDEIDIDFERDFGAALPCLPMPAAAADYIGYLAILPGDVLFKLYDDYGQRLLELNVRSFLSARGKVNSGIRRTLRDEADRFMAYNNGIVVTVDALETVYLPNGGPAIGRVRGLQIVNGGQTTASIHRARKVDGASLSSVFVPAKIIMIDPASHEEIVGRISRYANTQNVIQMADFSANEPFHVELERLSQRIWCPGEQGRWFYERARGQYQVAKSRLGATPAQLRRFNEQTPPNRKFSKTDLAKYQQAWLLRPHIISLGAQKNFDHFMQDLRARLGKDWLPEESDYRELVAKAIVYRAVERVVRIERFPAYRANIVAYLCAYLWSRASGRMDLRRIWQHQDLSNELKELLRTWSHEINAAIVQSAQGRNVTEWCKKEPCWEHIRALSLPLPTVLPIEMQAATDGDGSRWATPAGGISHEDLQSIERCRQVDGPTWLKISAWGSQSGNLERWQAGIAHTLAGYAANGWTRGPSPKQARHAMKILNLAAEHGILEASAPETQPVKIAIVEQGQET